MKAKSIIQFILESLALAGVAALPFAYAAEPEITAQSVAQDAAKEYKALVDQVIRSAVEATDKFSIDPNDLARARALEYELLGHTRLGVFKRAELPALVFAEGKPQTVEEIPGRALELRLLKLGVNPWDDGLSNKVFQYYSSEGYGKPIPFNWPGLSNKFPARGDFQASYSYGMALIGKRQWADAAKHLTDALAVPGGSTEGEWEFEVLVSRAWAEAMSGSFSKAKATLAEALSREHQCEVPVRARFLARVLGIAGQQLTPEVAAALPLE
jgi:hypothetical protein